MQIDHIGGWKLTVEIYVIFFVLSVTPTKVRKLFRAMFRPFAIQINWKCCINIVIVRNVRCIRGDFSTTDDQSELCWWSDIKTGIYSEWNFCSK